MGYLNAGTVQEKAFPRMNSPLCVVFQGPYPAGCADEKVDESGTRQCAVRMGATGSLLVLPHRVSVDQLAFYSVLVIDFGWDSVLVQRPGQI